MKAVLFDFNGTLFEDTRFHIAAWTNFWKKHLDLDLTEEEIRRRCIGPGNAEIFRDFYGGRLTQEQANELGEAKEEEYRASVLSNPENKKLRKGAPEFLDYLKERDIPFVLATASPLSNVEFYLNDLGMNRWFTLDRIVFEEGILPGKPDPAFYLEAARRIGLTPADCLIAEDSRTGILAAVRAGAGRLVVLGGNAPQDVLDSTPEIHAVVPDFCGFERFLND